MAYMDIASGHTYDHIIYMDAETVVFSSDHGESQISRGEFDAKAQVLPIEGEEFEPFAVDRFQAIVPIFEPTPLRIEERRATLDNYATANGGQILVHQQEEQPSRLHRLARYGRDLFRPT